MDSKVISAYLYMLHKGIMGYRYNDLDLIRKYQVTRLWHFPVIDLDNSPKSLENFKWTQE